MPYADQIQASLIKGTSSSSGYSVQNLSDSGRNVTNYFMTLPILTTATDALMSLTGFKGGAAITATTTPAVVTTGKTFRITSITVTYVGVLVLGTAKFTLRANPAGVVAITSPAVFAFDVGCSAAVAGVSSSLSISVPEGLEFSGGTGIGISMVGLSALQVAAAVGYGMCTIYGYEY